MLGLMFVLCVFGGSAAILYKLVISVKQFVFNRKNISVVEKNLQVKYENSMERLVNLYRDTNAQLTEQVNSLTEENRALVKVMDSELFEDADEEDDDDEREVVLTMDKPLRSSVGKVAEIGRQEYYSEIQSPSKLFKKIEAARKVVQATTILPDVKKQLIELLTPENDVEAA